MTGVMDVPEDSGSIDEDVLRRDNRALGQLVKVSLSLSSTLDIDKLLQSIMDAAATITGAQAASILLYDEGTNQLQFAASTGTSISKLRTIPVPLEGSIAGTILTENRAIIINDPQSDPRHFRQVDRQLRYETRSLVGVPMRGREKTTGVLEALNKQGGDFDEVDVRHLTILAAQAASAIENARLVEELQQALHDLDRVDKLKSDFIAIASHELRTPLGVVLGYASFLKDEAQGEASDHADAVLNSAIKMRSLIEDMTNLTHIQADTAELKLEAVTVNSMLREVQRDVSEMAHAKGQTFIVDVPVEQIEVRADRTRLILALTNVLNNAVKFTQEGGVIHLLASVKPKEVWVTVKDSGIGLEPHDLQRIFDQFFQVEDHMTRRYAGMGLGLAIANAIVERQGGRIWAESEGPGKGSAFHISLPLAYPP